MESTNAGLPGVEKKQGAWPRTLAALALCALALAGCGPGQIGALGPPGDDGVLSPADSGSPASSSSIPSGGGGSDAGSGQEPIAIDPGPPETLDLRADVNRDGTVDLEDPSENAGEDSWDATHGAIFLANIDDDRGTCAKTGTDIDLPKCNDAADEVINGDEDLADLARLKLKPWADAPDGAQGQITLSAPSSPYVRLFVNDQGTFKVLRPEADTLSTAQLRAGVELAIEGKDVLRDPAGWDGTADVTVSASGSSVPEGTSDTVRLRLAPVILRHHLDPPDKVYATYFAGDADSEAMVGGLQAAVSAAGVANPLVKLPIDDPWTQDLFETAYMAMPAVGGMQVIHVNIRSANVEAPRDAKNPLRKDGQIVFTRLRGKDVAGLSQYDLAHPADMDTLDSFGNTETIPPYSANGQSYPLGRIYRGRTASYYTDPKMTAMLEAQKVQPPIYVDTSWLLVAHVDETVTFLKANNARGWTIAVNDARLAKSMLEKEVQAGNGSAVLFKGLYWDDGNGQPSPAETTIARVLTDADVMAASARAAVEVDNQVAILKKEVGISDEEILHLPFLHWEVSGGSVAYQVGTVNGISLGDGHYGAPRPHGPVVNGRDIMEVQVEQELSRLGIAVHWIENWNIYHRNLGEVHCGSNTTRKVPASVRWWESGR